MPLAICKLRSIARRALICLFVGLSFGQDQGARLSSSGEAVLLNCDPATGTPAFRLNFNIVDVHGAPSAAEMPKQDRLADSMAIQLNDRSVTPFYASAQGESSSKRIRVALILVDISGSMNAPLASGESRFEAAKAAILSSLANFESGADEIAVVPFESHGVHSRISGAQFATTKADAIEQVKALPLPTPRNNTALFTAVVDGLDVLSRRRQGGSGASAESMLVVMTDGKNEVLPGDDPGLLEGPEGLEEASRKVKAGASQVVGVGFGDAAQIDEMALQRISTNYFMAQDRASLSRIFDFARILLHRKVVATVLSPWPDRASLASRTLQISAELKLPSGEVLRSGTQTWSTPQIGTPQFEGSCTAEESAALLPKQIGGPLWIPVLRPILVFVGIGTLFLVLWFWVPRLVWPEQYIGVLPSQQRWANVPEGRPVKPGPSGFGFTRNDSRTPARTPADPTIVQNRSDFGKTRLDRENS